MEETKEKSPYQLLGKPYRNKVGKKVFVVSSFGNMNSNKTAEEILLEMLSSKLEKTSDESEIVTNR